MEWSLIWKAILIVFVATAFLRIAGRKAISKMTLAETVLMISIGTLLIQPVARHDDIWTTFLIGGVLVGTLLVMEFIQIKYNKMEKLITGKAKIVINNGVLDEQNLKKLRLTVDQLEMKLRQKNVSKISDVKWATLEANGHLGLELKQDAQPVTKKDFEEFKQIMINLMLSNSKEDYIHEISNLINENNETKGEKNIFSEIQSKGHPTSPPKHLQ